MIPVSRSQPTLVAMATKFVEFGPKLAITQFP